MRFRRVIIFMLILFCSYTPPILASTMYDFTTSESIVINNVPGTSKLTINPLVIDNYGPALSIDSIRAESLGEWSIVSDSVTDWGNISADAKCFGIVCNSVDMSSASLINQGSLGTNESRTFNFTGHIGARREAVIAVPIAYIITSVTITEEPEEGGTTYVYQDGTLIINELETNHESNLATHGTVVGSYATYSPGTTNWNSANSVPWLEDGVRDSIDRVIFDTAISPTDMSYWFYNCSNITEFDFTNLDCSNCTAMNHTFDGLSGLEYLNICGIDTSSVQSMDGIFSNCSSLKRIYVDATWSTSSVIQGDNVVSGSTSLIGGDGHVYDSSADYTHLKYDSYYTPGYLTYESADKCIVTYNYNKTGYDFDSDFFNQVKSGDYFSCGGAGSQVHNPYTGDKFIIKGFGTSRFSRTVVSYTGPYLSKGNSMVMYAIFLYK